MKEKGKRRLGVWLVKEKKEKKKKERKEKKGAGWGCVGSTRKQIKKKKGPYDKRQPQGMDSKEDFVLVVCSLWKNISSDIG